MKRTMPASPRPHMNPSMPTNTKPRFSDGIIFPSTRRFKTTSLLPLNDPDLHSKVKVSPNGFRFFKKRPAYLQPERPIDRKPRGEVLGFSKGSARNFRECLMGLDLVPFLSHQGAAINNGFFITLDWPRGSHWTQETIATDLERFAKRFTKTYKVSLIGAIWRKELKENGTPHVHIIALFNRQLETEALAAWVKQVWTEITGENEPRAVDVRALYGPPAKLVSYLLKRPKGVQDNINLGRRWGKWLGKTLPLVEPEILGLSKEDYPVMIERLKRTPEGQRSKMIQKFHELWEGGRVIGDGPALKEILKDLPSEELQKVCTDFERG